MDRDLIHMLFYRIYLNGEQLPIWLKAELVLFRIEYLTAI